MEKMIVLIKQQKSVVVKKNSGLKLNFNPQNPFSPTFTNPLSTFHSQKLTQTIIFGRTFLTSQ